ncbi:MAG: ribosomal-processing cysteine protease Prp [Lachnospiraceae bacterium]|nr:ribosomal-processing cysteine protease Prp [Lachnospiraceae bacterium]
MTEIEIVKNQGEYRGFECHGHSGFAEEGDDIVCAAISVLTFNTVNSIDHLTDDEISVTTNEKEGDMQCYFLGKPSKEAILLIDSMILGLESISAQYGAQYLKIVIKEV